MFLKKLLPSEGYYCLAVLLANGGFRHHWHDNIDKLYDHALLLSNSGENVYIAQGGFDKESVEYAITEKKKLQWDNPERTKLKERGQKNVRLMRNFFLDIDCGEKWPLKSQREGVEELKKFLGETGLPFPSVVNSGNGLYAHWTMNADIAAQQWVTVARILKSVVATYSPKLGGDSSRTSDSASVLRPIGTMNRKPGFEPKPVSLLKDAEPIDLMEFAKILGKAARKQSLQVTGLRAPTRTKDINADFTEGLNEGPPSDANKVATQCGQLRTMLDAKGDVSEPLWYNCLGVLARCANGREIAHEWSSGHPQYSYGQTEQKIQQWLDSDIGPATCANFGMVNPAGCLGCPHINKIKSPIVLGRPDPVAVKTAEQDCPPPDGFRRAKDGLYADVDGRWVKFYPNDLYIASAAYDETLGYEVMTIRHSLPLEPNMECVLRSNLATDKKQLIAALADNHIKLVGENSKKLMKDYFEGYMQQIVNKRLVGRLTKQMGWKTTANGENIFVLGKKIFRPDGSIDDASFARNVPQAATAFHSEGSLEEWVEATAMLALPGMEALAFGFSVGALAAPLMVFTGFSGALLSMVGESGIGKTLILRMICSMYGKHSDLIMLRDDTRNSLISRLGVYGCLPMTIDETTNMEGMELSQMVYATTQGREKTRLTRSARERETPNQWNTIAVTSTNSSLVDKLAGAKLDASAEINRIFEYQVYPHDEFSGKTTEDLYWAITKNYGHAGEKYIQYLVTHREEVESQIVKARSYVDSLVNLRSEERFRGAILSATLVGLLIARSIGIIKFEASPLMNWAHNQMTLMRQDTISAKDTAVETLAQYLAEMSACRLIVRGGGNGSRKDFIHIETPRAGLFIRIEIDTKLLYISRAHIKAWINKRSGSYTLIRRELVSLGVMKPTDQRRNLGLGTTFSGAPQACWCIDMTSKDFMDHGYELLDYAETLNNIDLEKGGKK